MTALDRPDANQVGRDHPESERFLERIGERVRRARGQRRLSRKALAEASGVSERYLAELEKGAGNISILLLRQVAAALGLLVEDLVSERAPDAPDLLALMELARKAGPEERARLAESLGASLGEAGADLRAGRVALIGLRGAGKSTLGRLLAVDLGVPFVELNREIEADSGLAIGEIFSLYGEEGYRRLEQRCLRAVTERYERAVLAVGGGIVAESVTFDMLLRSFHTVWLQASPQEHMERVRAQGDKRPMAGNPDAMEDLRGILAERTPLYARAETALDTSRRSVDRSRRDLNALVAGWFAG